MKDMQKQKLIAIGRQIWQSLTDDEQENYYYYTAGKIGFLEDVAQILHIDMRDADVSELLAAVFE